MAAWRGRLASGVAAMAVAASGAPVGAVSWILDGDGNWATAANWSTGALPGPMDDVLIDVGGAVVRVITHNSGNNSVRTITSAEDLRVFGGTLSVSGIYSNSATTQVGNATLRLDGAATLDKLFMLGAGRLDGAGLVTVLGEGINLGNSQHIGAGTTRYEGAVSALGSSVAVRLDGGRTVEYRGGYTTGTNFAEWDLDFTDAEGAGLLRNGAGSQILDQAGASNAGRIWARHGGPAMFENLGTYRKDSIATGFTTIETAFLNLGSVEVAGGRIEIIGPLGNASDATTLSGGRWVIEQTSETDFGELWFHASTGLDSIVTNNAEIVFVGANSTLVRSGVGLGGEPGEILGATLERNAAGGTFRLQAGATLGTASPTFTNEGLVILEQAAVFSSIFNAPAVVNSGEFRGVGEVIVPGAFDNQGGVIRAFEDPVTGRILNIFAESLEGGTLATAPGGRLRLNITFVPTVDVIDHQGTQLRAFTPAAVMFVTTDYRNAGFGTGDAFNPIGNGVVVDVRATGAGQALTAPGLVGGETATPVVAFNAREGDATPFLVTITNTGAETILRGAVRTVGAPLLDVTGGESFMIVPGGTVQFGISTAGLPVGAFGGQSVVVANNFSNVDDQTLSISGAIFRLAEAEVSAVAPPLVVRVGDAALAVVALKNIAPADGFSEGLVVKASAAGDLGGLAPEDLVLLAGEGGQVSAVFDTSSAGVKSGSVDLVLQSGGESSSGLVPIGIGGESVGFSVTVNSRAAPVFTRFGTALGFDETLGGYVLDLGVLDLGAMAAFGDFGLGNLVMGPADDLSGTVALLSGGPWGMGGAFDVGLLSAGTLSGPFGVSFDAATLGVFLGELAFTGLGTNLSDPVGEERLARLFLRVSVRDAQGVIPEPGAWAMMIAGFGAVGAAARRRRSNSGLAG